MKIFKRGDKIFSGVRLDSNGKYVFDYYSNSDSDLINIQDPRLYESIFGNKVYRFGWQFTDIATSKDRTLFINFLKGIGDYKISEDELVKFISRPLASLDASVNLYDIDFFIYPLSKRSKLVSDIVKVINRCTSRDMEKMSFELVKSIPNDVEFDWNSFIADIGDDNNRLSQMTEYVKNELMPKIHTLDYFSLVKSVKPEYRSYITNYLRFSSEDADKIASLENKTMLIVDDMNTSGSTLDEILRIIGKLNNKCIIYIYTLPSK